MKHTHTPADDPAVIALVLLALGIEATARYVLAPALALVLALLNYAPTKPAPRPAPACPFPFPAPAPVVATTRRAFFEAMTVRELRTMARNKGHRAIARSGRRQQLLEVLA